MKNITSFALVAFAFACSACGTQWSGNYNGTLSGSYNSTSLTTTTFNMSLYQQGSNVTGTWIATGSSVVPLSGQLTGTVSGNQLNNVQFIVPTLETSSVVQPGTYTGTGFTLNSSQLAGSLTGAASTGGGSLSASLNLTQSK